jgi:hypothetical protein
MSGKLLAKRPAYIRREGRVGGVNQRSHPSPQPSPLAGERGFWLLPVSDCAASGYSECQKYFPIAASFSSLLTPLEKRGEIEARNILWEMREVSLIRVDRRRKSK